MDKGEARMPHLFFVSQNNELPDENKGSTDYS